MGVGQGDAVQSAGRRQGQQQIRLRRKGQGGVRADGSPPVRQNAAGGGVAKMQAACFVKHCESLALAFGDQRVRRGGKGEGAHQGQVRSAAGPGQGPLLQAAPVVGDEQGLAPR